jgi:hypothetical protein
METKPTTDELAPKVEPDVRPEVQPEIETKPKTKSKPKPKTKITKSEIIEFTPGTDRKVNTYKDKKLAFEYCIHDDKLYKKIGPCAARKCTLQNNKHGYQYYYVKGEDGKAITMNTRKLDALTYTEPKPKDEVKKPNDDEKFIMSKDELTEFLTKGFWDNIRKGKKNPDVLVYKCKVEEPEEEHDDDEHEFEGWYGENES